MLPGNMITDHLSAAELCSSLYGHPFTLNILFILGASRLKNASYCDRRHKISNAATVSDNGYFFCFF